MDFPSEALKNALKGDTISQFILYAYYSDKNSTKLALFFENMFQKTNNSDAMVIIGNCYFSGYFIEKDYKKAFKWYTKSAKLGNFHGQYNLADCYYNAQGVDYDYTKAFELYTKSAEQGSLYAQDKLQILRNPKKYKKQ